MKKVNAYIYSSIRGVKANKSKCTLMMEYVNQRGIPYRRIYVEEFVKVTRNYVHIFMLEKALCMLLYPCVVSVYIDSNFIKDMFDKRYLDKWEKAGWINAKNKKLLYKDLLSKIWQSSKAHKINICTTQNVHELIRESTHAARSG